MHWNPPRARAGEHPLPQRARPLVPMAVLPATRRRGCQPAAGPGTAAWHELRRRSSTPCRQACPLAAPAGRGRLQRSGLLLLQSLPRRAARAPKATPLREDQRHRIWTARLASTAPQRQAQAGKHGRRRVAFRSPCCAAQAATAAAAVARAPAQWSRQLQPPRRRRRWPPALTQVRCPPTPRRPLARAAAHRASAATSASPPASAQPPCRRLPACQT